MRLERREHRPVYLLVGSPIAAVVSALLLAGILIAIAGAPVLEAYRRILIGAFGSRLSATETLRFGRGFGISVRKASSTSALSQSPPAAPTCWQACRARSSFPPCY
jgi:hypothetical protein